MQNRKPRAVSLFQDQRLRLDDSIDLSIQSLNAYGTDYDHWAVAYSGGKDSTATVLLVAWAIKQGLVPKPKSLTILYADTRQELPPLQTDAMKLLAQLEEDGFDTKVVLPSIENRFYVYMLGRGVPPPTNRFRWCTPRIKVEPMMDALSGLREQYGQKFLMVTGVRLGESEVRDQRIALSCSKDSGECGQGWFQTATDDAVADTLAPLVHWRLCHVFDWLYFENGRHGYPQSIGIADVYGDDDVRTGCIGCNLASRDNALERLLKNENYAHLKPLMEIKSTLREMKKPQYRLRKETPEVTKSGKYAKNGQRMGPLHMEARAHFLETFLDIQKRAGIDLINAEEESAIRQMWADNVWPDGWSGEEIHADVPVPNITVIKDGYGLVTQPLLLTDRRGD